MRRWPSAGLLLDHHLRRWPNSKPTWAQWLMVAGYVVKIFFWTLRSRSFSIIAMLKHVDPPPQKKNGAIYDCDFENKQMNVSIHTSHLYCVGKWNESGFRPLLCTHRLNWARRTSWGRWEEWDDTALQTQNSKFKPWMSEAEQATSRSQRLPTIGLLNFMSGWGRNILFPSSRRNTVWGWPRLSDVPYNWTGIDVL